MKFLKKKIITVKIDINSNSNKLLRLTVICYSGNIIQEYINIYIFLLYPYSIMYFFLEMFMKQNKLSCLFHQIRVQ